MGALRLVADHPEFGTPENPSVGGVPWDGSIYLTPPSGLSPETELAWRLDHDLVWTMEHLITILSKDQNRPVAFKLNMPQRWAMWNLIEMLATGRPSWGWFLKGRQFGFSTLFMVILFICAMRGQNGLLLAHLEKPGQSIFRKAELALKSLPQFELEEEDEEGNVTTTQVVSLVPPPTSFSKESLMAWVSKGHNATLRRDSAENRDAGVGETYQNLQITEAPLFADAAHTIGHLLPALSATAGTFVNGEFTARTEGDYAHIVWLQSLEPDGLFRAVFCPWYWHLPYQVEATRDDAPFTPEEERYRASIRIVGSEYPLGEDGRLIPRLASVYKENGRVRPSDLVVGYELTDEQLLFRRRMIKSFAGDLKLWASEFPGSWQEAFRTAGRKLIPSEVMDVIEQQARDPLEGKAGVGEYVAHLGVGGKGKVRWMPRRDGKVHRFELPQAGATYLGWADPSSGTGVDPTGAGVYKVSYGLVELVLSFEDFRRPHDVARLLARFSRHYKDDMELGHDGKVDPKSGRPHEVAVERNGFGEAVITELQRLKVRRIWRYSDRTKDNPKHGHDYGFPTYKNTKNPMLHKFGQAAYDMELLIPCRRVHVSMRGMQYLDDKDEIIGAPRGQHDDLAMGGGIGFWAASEKAAFRMKPVESEPAWIAERLLFPNAG